MSHPLNLAKVIKPQAGWYRGDFHAHTNFSDGHYPPPELVGVARAEGLDFFAITDHNTIDAYPHFGNPPDLLVIPGLEVTVKAGHFNVFGLEGQPDWLASATWPNLDGPYNTMTGLMEQIAGEGLLNSINHPLLHPWEWRDGATDLRHVHCLEIWNDPSWPDNKQANPQAVDLWAAWLKAGYRLTAIGGSDYHRPDPAPNQNKPPERLGLPSTYVYAENLSGAAILAGLRRRQVYVSMGVQVSFQAQANGRIYEIGADLGELRGDLAFAATVYNCPATAQAQIVKNDEIVAETQVTEGKASLDYAATIDPAQAAWYRLDVWGQDGQMLAITNPIFAGPRREPALRTYGDFVSYNEDE